MRPPWIRRGPRGFVVGHVDSSWATWIRRDGGYVGYVVHLAAPVADVVSLAPWLIENFNLLVGVAQWQSIGLWIRGLGVRNPSPTLF